MSFNKKVAVASSVIAAPVTAMATMYTPLLNVVASADSNVSPTHEEDTPTNPSVGDNTTKKTQVSTEADAYKNIQNDTERDTSASSHDSRAWEYQNPEQAVKSWTHGADADYEQGVDNTQTDWNIATNTNGKTAVDTVKDVYGDTASNMYNPGNVDPNKAVSENYTNSENNDLKSLLNNLYGYSSYSDPLIVNNNNNNNNSSNENNNNGNNGNNLNSLNSTGDSGASNGNTGGANVSSSIGNFKGGDINQGSYNQDNKYLSDGTLNPLWAVAHGVNGVYDLNDYGVNAIVANNNNNNNNNGSNNNANNATNNTSNTSANAGTKNDVNSANNGAKTGSNNEASATTTPVNNDALAKNDKASTQNNTDKTEQAQNGNNGNVAASANTADTLQTSVGTVTSTLPSSAGTVASTLPQTGENVMANRSGQLVGAGLLTSTIASIGATPLLKKALV